MKILSIDTCSDVCGVSILKNTNLLISLDSITGKTHSCSLMPFIQKAFSNLNLSLKDIDLIVCDKGPGSFTGIRIGIATAKAFQDSFDIPCVGISSLESLGYNVCNTLDEENLVCSIIDCKNDNCYFALYEKKNGILKTLIEPQAESIDVSLSIINSYCEDTLSNPLITFVGDGAKNSKEKILSIFPNSKFANLDELNNLNSYNLGIAGYNTYLSSPILDELLPLYLKKPQAQRQLEEKLKNNN